MYALRANIRLIAFIFAPAPIFAQFPVTDISASGVSRFTSDEVAAASGLKIGQVAGPADFDGATQRLMNTGMFRSVNYRYAPKAVNGKAGYSLQFAVTEENPSQPVILDFMGIVEEKLWTDLRNSAPLLRPAMPANQQAEAYYRSALEALLKSQGRAEPVASALESDLVTGKTSTLFRPAHLPKIREVQFVGNQSIDSKTLHEALDKLTIGEEFTARGFTQRVELNLRPLYERQARLAVKFSPPEIVDPGADAVSLRLGVEEGPQWTLGKVALQGDPQTDELYKAARFTVGELATSDSLTVSLSGMEKVLKRNGYLAMRSKVIRSFHADAAVVDLSIDVARGPQFSFGELQITGVPEDLQKKIAARFRLKTGDPVDGPYLDDFPKEAAEIARGQIRGISSEPRPRPGLRVIDYRIAFR